MRAWLFFEDRFFYPDEDLKYPERSLSTWWGILHAYRLSGKLFSVDRPSGILDCNGVEIYEGDEVELTHRLTASEIKAGYNVKETGICEFNDGGYVLINPSENLYSHLCDHVPEGMKVNRKIVSHKYQRNGRN